MLINLLVPYHRIRLDLAVLIFVLDNSKIIDIKIHNAITTRFYCLQVRVGPG